MFSVLPYQIQVFTSDEEMDSGTESHVFITLYGQESDTGRRHLHLADRKTFQTGQVSTLTESAMLQLKEPKMVVLYNYFE